MRKGMVILGIAAATLFAAVLPLTPAMAAGAGLACNVSPGNGIFFPNTCANGVASFSYTITYEVQGETGSVSYSWTPPGLIVSGCTSTSSDCAVSVTQGHADTTRKATVVVTRGSTHTTLTATADLAAVCAGASGPVFC